jgi:hypothetical protein
MATLTAGYSTSPIHKPPTREQIVKNLLAAVAEALAAEEVLFRTLAGDEHIPSFAVPQPAPEDVTHPEWNEDLNPKDAKGLTAAQKDHLLTPAERIAREQEWIAKQKARAARAAAVSKREKREAKARKKLYGQSHEVTRSGYPG